MVIVDYIWNILQNGDSKDTTAHLSKQTLNQYILYWIKVIELEIVVNNFVNCDDSYVKTMQCKTIPFIAL